MSLAYIPIIIFSDGHSVLYRSSSPWLQVNTTGSNDISAALFSQQFAR